MISLTFWLLSLLKDGGEGIFINSITAEDVLNLHSLFWGAEFLLFFVLQMLICVFARRKWMKRLFPVLIMVEFALNMIATIPFALDSSGKYMEYVLFLPSSFSMVFLIAVLLANVVYRLVNYVKQKNQNTVLQVE